MRVAVICESSGIVRSAFCRAGHSAVSFDLLPTRRPGAHIRGDVRLVSRDYLSQFDLAVCHPPCTRLAVSGARYFAEHQQEQTEALEFVQWLLELPIPKIALENPVSVISSKIRKPDQIIQPFQFGHPESKKTCLWLKNLPELLPTNVLPLPECGHWANQTPSGQNKLGPSPDRAERRSATYPGIAAAMAQQWGARNA